MYLEKMRATDKNGSAGRDDAGGAVGKGQNSLRRSHTASVLAAARQCHMAALEPHQGGATELTKTKERRSVSRQWERATYASESESSVSRLLATLLCRPSESSL
jgi:hypothetical protein